MATRHGLDGPGWNPRGGDNIFRAHPDRPGDPPSLQYNGYRVSFPRCSGRRGSRLCVELYLQLPPARDTSFVSAIETSQFILCRKIIPVVRYIQNTHMHCSRQSPAVRRESTALYTVNLTGRGDDCWALLHEVE